MSTRPERVRDALEKLAAQGVNLHGPRRVAADEECRNRWHEQDGEREPAYPSCRVEGE